VSVIRKIWDQTEFGKVDAEEEFRVGNDKIISLIT